MAMARMRRFILRMTIARILLRMAIALILILLLMAIALILLILLMAIALIFILLIGMAASEREFAGGERAECLRQGLSNRKARAHASRHVHGHLRDRRLHTVSGPTDRSEPKAPGGPFLIMELNNLDGGLSDCEPLVIIPSYPNQS